MPRQRRTPLRPAARTFCSALVALVACVSWADEIRDPPPYVRPLTEDEDRRYQVLISRARSTQVEGPEDLEPILTQILELERRTFGREHPESIGTEVWLSTILFETGRSDAARELLAHALPIVKARGARPDSRLNALDLLAELDGPAAAEPHYREHLSRMLERFGPDSVHTTHARRSLALALAELGHWEEAEGNWRAIVERLSQENPTELDLDLLRFRLATALRHLDRCSEAEPILNEVSPALIAKTEAEGRFGVLAANELALCIASERGFAESARYQAAALQLSQEHLGESHRTTGSMLVHIAQNLAELGRAGEAEGFWRRAIASSSGWQFETPETRVRELLEVKMGLAENLTLQGQFQEAFDLWEEIHAESEQRLGMADTVTLRSLNGLGLTHKELGRLGQSEQVLRRAVVGMKEVYGEDHPEFARSLNNLAATLFVQNRIVEAESYLRSVASILEKHQGLEDETARILANIAVAISDQGRYVEAEMFALQALERIEAAKGDKHPETLEIHAVLGTILRGQGRTAEALSVLWEAFQGMSQAGLALADPKVLNTALALAACLNDEKQAGEAVTMLRAVRDNMIEKGQAAEGSFPVLRVDIAIADIAFENGLIDPAAVIYEDVLADLEQQIPPYHPFFLNVASSVARAALKLGNFKRALVLSADIIDRLWEMLRHEALLSHDLYRQSFVGSIQSMASVLVGAAWELAQNPEAEPASPWTSVLAWENGGDARAITFMAAQLFADFDTASALGRSTARIAAPEESLIRLVRSIEELKRVMSAADQALLRFISDPSKEAEELRQYITTEKANSQVMLRNVTAGLREKFPRFFDLTNPVPVKLEDLQPLLREREALVLLLQPMDEHPGMVWAVSRDAVGWAAIPWDEQELRGRIDRLRAPLKTPAQRLTSAVGGAAEATTAEPARGVVRLSEGTPIGFPRREAETLYDGLFGDPEIAAVLENADHWLIVAQGLLLSLPFATLVTETPQGGPAGDKDPRLLRQTAWLGVERSLSILPSVSSLRSLRQSDSEPKKARDATPFFGVGDPIFEGPAAVGDLPEMVGDLPDMRSCFSDGRANLASLRKLPRLPGTAAEVLAMAEILGADDEAYALRGQATETEVRSRSDDGRLARARIVLFATHGLIAGDLGNTLAEPALALSLPAQATETDDGLLTASEVATLRLDADWVILSACNTAAGRHSGAAGLTGLAQAFLYAGARSLLVSQWPVRDNTVGRLTTKAIRNRQSDPSLAHAEALRRSMWELMDDVSADTGEASFAHPAHWAPLMVVGD